MNWKLISKYRPHIMGLATLWILLLHSTAWFSSFPLGCLKATGYCGVDLFLFLSAVGLYFSWQNNKQDTVSFLKRRFLRLFPAYILIALIRCFLENTGKRYFVLLITTLSFWILDDLSVWFIAGIVILYLLTPLILKTMEKAGKSVLVLYIGLAFLVGYLMKGTPQNLFFARIPSFLFGFLAAPLVYHGKEVTKKETIQLWIAFLLGAGIMIAAQKGLLAQYAVLDWAARYYSVLLFGLPLMFGDIWVLEKQNQKGEKYFSRFLDWIGSISLEMYLWFEVLLRKFRGTAIEFLPFEYHGVVYSLIIAVLTTICAWIVHNVVKRITPILMNKTCRNG